MVQMSKIEFLLNVVSNMAGELLFAALAVTFGIIAMKYRAVAGKFGKGKLTKSPDGNSVVSEDVDEIYVANKGGIKNISNNPAIDKYPLWSPDSNWISFQSNRGGLWRVWVADVVSGKLAQLTGLIGMNRAMYWDDECNLHIDLGGSVLAVKRDEIRKRLGK